MNELVVKLPRRMIPRWRDFSTTAAIGELGPIKPKVVSGNLLSNLETAKSEWYEFKSPMTAGSLLMASLTEKNWTLAYETALFLSNPDVAAPPFTKEFARTVLHWVGNEEAFPIISPSASEATAFQTRTIGITRRLLARFPESAIHWVELALGYAIIGKADKARDAIFTALHLAPNDRYVIRSATRFFLFHEEPEAAQHALVRSPRTRADSWLLAAHLSVAKILDESPVYMKQAKATFASENISHFHRSELGAALATDELLNGNDKRSKKLFKESLVKPTENSLAQALWAKHQITQIATEQQQNLLHLPLSFEANARVLVSAEKWKEALEAVKCWQNDEPFAARPAILASYLASAAMDDYAESVRLARAGLMANPNDATLLNNIAFAEANAGNLDIARQALSKLHRSSLNRREQIPWIATEGLVAFRSGDPESGRRLYTEAMDLALQEKENDLFIRASIFLAREEVRAGSINADAAVTEVRQALTAIKEPTAKLALRKLNNELRTARKPTIEVPTTVKKVEFNRI